MRNTVVLFALLALALVLVGCGGTKTYEIEQRASDDAQPPTWYPRPTPDDDYLYAAATELSADLQTAVDKAMIKGRGELAKQLALKLDAIESLLADETGFKENAKLESAYRSAIKVTADESLAGSRMKDRHLVREGDMWRAYVLMELPLAPVRQGVVDGVKANPELYDKLGSSKTFKDIGG